MVEVRFPLIFGGNKQNFLPFHGLPKPSEAPVLHHCQLLLEASHTTHQDHEHAVGGVAVAIAIVERSFCTRNYCHSNQKSD
jgi:hypothetical protein